MGKGGRGGGRGGGGHPLLPCQPLSEFAAPRELSKGSYCTPRRVGASVLGHFLWPFYAKAGWL